MRLAVSVSSEIKKPLTDVFDAVIKAKLMTNYFISDASGDMIEGKTVTWTFGDVGENGVSFPVKIEEVRLNEFIAFSWGPAGSELRVEMKFETLGIDRSKISIKELDFELTEEGAKTMMGQTHGWTDFMCCLKAYLYTGINLRSGEMPQA